MLQSSVCLCLSQADVTKYFDPRNKLTPCHSVSLLPSRNILTPQGVTTCKWTAGLAESGCGLHERTQWRSSRRLPAEIQNVERQALTGFGPLISKYRLLLTSCKPTSIYLRTLKYPVKTQHLAWIKFPASCSCDDEQPDYSAIYLDHSTGH